MQDLTALRADTEKKRDTLTALRIKVSEGPTVSNVHGLGETIDTIDYVTRIGNSSRAVYSIYEETLQGWSILDTALGQPSN